MSDSAISATSTAGRIARILEHDDIATVRVEHRGRVLYDRRLAVTDTSDYGYEGCYAKLVRWFGEDLVIISFERGRHYLWSFADDRVAAAPGFVFSAHYVVSGDLLLWVDHYEPGLLRCVQLPALDTLASLPMRGSEKDVRLIADDAAITIEGGAFPDTLRLPALAQRVPVPSATATRIETVLQELLPPHDLTAMIIGSAAHAFWQPPPTPSEVSPVFLPIYWYRHLAKPAAAELLALLDAIAAPLAATEPEVGWRPEWTAAHGVVMLAARHVQRRAAMYAEICRSGDLPRGWWCLLFETGPQQGVGSRVNLAHLSASLRPYFSTLVATRPAKLKHVF